jgi:hypothetical protein
MRFRTPLSFLALTLALGTAASAQVSGPGSNPPAPTPTPTGPSGVYVPLFGVSAGIAIPAGRLGDDHSAGFMLGGLTEYVVQNQPYSLRGEATYQRFPRKQNRELARDVNLIALGTTIVYRMQMNPAETFLTGGIAVYNATGEGTHPGFNLGTGIGFPLTGFSALAEIRLHVMLADNKPVLALPLSVGVRF